MLAVNQGGGVVLLTDLLGGSTTNLCLSLLAEENVEVVTGVNLPMLLKLNPLRARVATAAELARELAAVGQKSIIDASDSDPRAEARAAVTAPLLVRVDNRLVHGQVLEAWVPALEAKALWVADDEAAGDALAQLAMGLAIPSGVTLEVMTLAQAAARLGSPGRGRAGADLVAPARGAERGDAGGGRSARPAAQPRQRPLPSRPHAGGPDALSRRARARRARDARARRRRDRVARGPRRPPARRSPRCGPARADFHSVRAPTSPAR